MTETPEDIATLYSRARMEWTRYWDFSASRKQVRQQLGVMREPLEWPSTPLPVAEFSSQSEEELPQVPLQEVEIEDPSFRIPKLRRRLRSRRLKSRRLKWNLRDRNPSRTPHPGAATRWYALRSIFAPAQASVDSSSFPAFEQRPPILVVFSLAGGVGKTCLVATLGRLLSALGEPYCSPKPLPADFCPSTSARAN